MSTHPCRFISTFLAPDTNCLYKMIYKVFATWQLQDRLHIIKTLNKTWLTVKLDKTEAYSYQRPTYFVLLDFSLATNSLIEFISNSYWSDQLVKLFWVIAIFQIISQSNLQEQHDALFFVSHQTNTEFLYKKKQYYRRKIQGFSANYWSVHCSSWQ